MTTNAETTALTREQVETQLRAWFAAGLPEGQILFVRDEPKVHVKMPEPGSVVVWAQALGCRDVEWCGAVYSTLGCEPVALNGWLFEVWCDAPVVPAELRIKIRPDGAR